MSEVLGNQGDAIDNKGEAYGNQAEKYDHKSWGDWDESPVERSDGLEISEDTREAQMNSAIEAVEKKDWGIISSLLNNPDLQPTVAEYIVVNSSFSQLIRLTYTSISPATADIILNKKEKDTVFYKDEGEKQQILNTLHFLQDRILVK